MTSSRRAALWLLASAVVAAAGEGRRALIVDVDGVRRDTFQQAYNAGLLPVFERLLGWGMWYDRAESVLPTVTMAAQSSIFTGTPPARHGIPGNQWFDRASARSIEYLSSSTVPCVFAFTLLGGAECRDGLLNSHLLAPTLYEAATAAGRTSAVVFHPVWRGATRPVLPSMSEGLAMLVNGGLDFEAFDRRMAQRAVATIEGRGIPDILTVYFAGADEIGHSSGIDAQMLYLANVVDPLLGEIVRALETRDSNWFASAMIVVASDHGRTTVEAHPGDRTLARDLAAAVARAGFLSDQIQLSDNGGMAYLYLKSGNTWGQPPPAERVAAAIAEIAADPVLSKVVREARPRREDESARFGDVIVFLTPGHYFGNPGTGSHHGNADALDLAVTLVVARPDGPAGHSDAPAGITRIAATVAQFLGFPLPGADPALPLP
jgi:hypothetical protein